MIFDFGYRLRELRVQKKLTQAQVAKRLSLSKATISGYENNIKTPSLDVLVKLANLYGVSSDYILGLQSHQMLSVDGLTERQQEIVNSLLCEFRSKK